MFDVIIASTNGTEYSTTFIIAMLAVLSILSVVVFFFIVRLIYKIRSRTQKKPDDNKEDK
jgi:Na+/H+ antiporter NhaD/arsenite permease-like protein